MNPNETIAGIEWHANGYFRCATTAKCVRGVAGDIHTLSEFARRAGVLRTSRHLYEASDEFTDIGCDEDAWSLARDHFESDFRMKRADVAAISQLRAVADSLPVEKEALTRLAQSRADDLNAVAPLVPSPRAFVPTAPGIVVADNHALRGFAAWVDWIAPEKIIASRADAWNDINRTPRRNSVITIAEALVGSELHSWVERMSSSTAPVVAVQVEGPAGPIYEVNCGTHRAHAARLFDLPLLALVKPAELPVAVRPADAEMSAIWSGLVERGLLTAEVSADRWWYVQSVVAEWMLAPPALATEINTAYERVYPGALAEATGLSIAELTAPGRWKRALGRRPWWRRA